MDVLCEVLKHTILLNNCQRYLATIRNVEYKAAKERILTNTPNMVESGDI